MSRTLISEVSPVSCRYSTWVSAADAFTVAGSAAVTRAIGGAPAITTWAPALQLTATRSGSLIIGRLANRSLPSASDVSADVFTERYNFDMGTSQGA